jgi:regulator of replication initiation timing
MFFVEKQQLLGENAALKNENATLRKRIAELGETLIDATINFELLPQLPATPTILKSSVQNSDFFDCRRGRRFTEQAQILLAAQ